MAAEKPTIFYNHNYKYSFQGVIDGDDRAMQFGDGVYEWVRIHKGKTFALSYHTDRLYRSMRLIGIRATIAPDEFTEINEIVAEENQIEEGYCLIVVTRGSGDHDFTIPGRMALTPNIMVYAKSLDMAPIEEVQKGVSAITAEDDRWAHCDILALNMLPNMMARAKALKKGAFESIYIHDGHVTEATKSNLFVVKDGVAWTAPADSRMLKGITRQLVFTRVAPTSGVTVIEKDITPDLLMGAEEVFLTNSKEGIIPVLSIDGKTIAGGKVGPVTAKLQLHYSHLLEEGLP